MDYTDNTTPIYFKNGNFRLSSIPGHPVYFGLYSFQIDCDIVHNGKTIFRAGKIFKYPEVLLNFPSRYIMIEYMGEAITIPCDNIVIGKGELKECCRKAIVMKAIENDILGVMQSMDDASGEVEIELSDPIMIDGKEFTRLKVKL